MSNNKYIINLTIEIIAWALPIQKSLPSIRSMFVHVLSNKKFTVDSTTLWLQKTMEIIVLGPFLDSLASVKSTRKECNHVPIFASQKYEGKKKLQWNNFPIFYYTIKKYMIIIFLSYPIIILYTSIKKYKFYKYALIIQLN